jgi:hypothetical protein
MGRERATPDELASLFDLLVAEERVTKSEIMRHLGVRARRADVVIHDLRLMFGDDDTINLVCERVGAHRPHAYFLTGQLDGAKPWTLERIGDAETRLETIAAVVQSFVNGTDGRTVDGKLARLFARTLERAREDIALLKD